MDKLIGTVNEIRFSTEVGGTSGSTSTNHVAVFKLDSQHVELKLRNSVLLNNGDQALIVGVRRSGRFEGLAYKNISSGAVGKSSAIPFMFFAVLFSTIGLSALPSIYGWAFTPVGLYCWWVYLRTLSANRELHNYCSINSRPAPIETMSPVDKKEKIAEFDTLKQKLLTIYDQNPDQYENNSSLLKMVGQLKTMDEYSFDLALNKPIKKLLDELEVAHQ
ncbi:hypothetical protein H4F17_08895 [Vibrio cholerae]